MYCKHCGAKNEADSKFCKECGEKFSQDSIKKKMCCRRCGAEVKDIAKFCKECGAEIKRDNEIPEGIQPKKTSDENIDFVSETISLKKKEVVQNITPNITEVIFCPNCESQVKPDCDYCNICKEPFNSIDTTSSHEITKKSVSSTAFDSKNEKNTIKTISSKNKESIIHEALDYINNKIIVTTKFSNIQDFVANKSSLINKLHWISFIFGLIFYGFGFLSNISKCYYVATAFILLFVGIELFAMLMYGMFKRKKYTLNRSVDHEALKNFLSETLTSLGFTNWALQTSAIGKHILIRCIFKGRYITIDFGKNANSMQYNIKVQLVQLFISAYERACIANPILSAAVNYYCTADDPQELEKFHPY